MGQQNFTLSQFKPHAFELIKEGVLPQPIIESVYESWVKKFRNNQQMQSQRIDYQSDGLNVAAIYLKPEAAKPKAHPLVIFNRGGRGRYGMINVLTINNLLSPLIDKGYVVAASQYRGVDGGEGEDEFGGGEVQDVVELAKLAKDFPEWDGKNIYMFGWSRGGMTTLLALKYGVEVNAIALGAPLIDLTLSTSQSGIREDWLKRVLPDYETEGYEALERRSAPYWLNKLNNTPTLLMHGDADADVSVIHSRQLAQKLKARGQACELIEYEGGNHYLNRQRHEVLDRVDEWFLKYRR